MRCCRSAAWARVLVVVLATQGAGATAEVAQQVRVTGAVVNVRQQPNTSAPVVFQARSGQVFDVLTVQGDWIQIQAPDGQKGFIFHEFLEVIPRPGPGGPSPAVAPTPGPTGGPLIDHTPLECVVAERNARVEARFGVADVAWARVYFKAEAGIHWYYVDMAPGAGRYAGTLPKPKRETKRINYYVEAFDKAKQDARTKDYAPEVVEAGSECSKKMAAMMFPGGAPLKVVAEPGAPPVPEGFEAEGLATSTGTAGATATGSHKTAFLIGGAAVAVGAVALIAKGGGSGCTSNGLSLAIKYGFTGSFNCTQRNAVQQTYSLTNNTCLLYTSDAADE